MEGSARITLSRGAVLTLSLLAAACLTWPANAEPLELLADTAETLGIAPGTPLAMQTVFTRKPQTVERPDLDIVRVDVGNVARNRWLFAIHTAAPYGFGNSGLILYLDADSDPGTGRTDMGCEFMFAHSAGAPGLTAFAPDGSSGTGRPPRLAIVDGVLLMCVDADIRQQGGQSALRFTVLSETVTPHASVSSTGWVEATGPADSNQEPFALLGDIPFDENFEVTEGLDLIWELQADPANICFRTPDAELRNFAYYDAEYRWWAVTGGEGSIKVTVPRAGRYYPAVVVYDSGGREAYELRVDGRRLGAFVAAEDDRRQRIHFLSEALDFKGGETLTFRTGGDGAHVTEDIMLLAAKPPVRGRRFAISQAEATHAGDGQMRLTWITTWPAACTIIYNDGRERRTVTEQEAVANHRVYLTDLTPGATYQWRLEASRPDGSLAYGPVQRFTATPAEPVAGTTRRGSFPVRVQNPYPFDLTGAPITNGVPFAKGELGDAGHVRLLDAAGRDVPLQTKITMRWLDGSIKWLLLDFRADVPAQETATYTVEYGSEVVPSETRTTLSIAREGEQITVCTGSIAATFDGTLSGFPVRLVHTPAGDDGPAADVTAGQLMGLELSDTQGTVYDTRHAPESIEVEETGPLRCVVKVTGHHQSAAGVSLFTYRNRFVFYAGSPLVRLYTTWGNDQPGAFTSIRGLSLQIPGPEGRRRWALGVDGGVAAEGVGAVSLRQLEDDSFRLETAAGPTDGERAAGWLDIGDGQRGLTVMVRDFWQLYPKALRADASGTVSLDLLPAFPDGTYDDCTELDEIKLYYYLQDGQYKLRQGMTKQHEVLLWPHAASTPVETARLAESWQDPPVALCDPERYCDTRVFGEILPATTGRWPEYERVCEDVYQGYLAHQKATRGYGMLNYGDQFGERKVNWANGEYDHHHAFLMQLIRCSDPKWYRLGERAARHAIDVDTAHYGPNAGGEWIHSMGHTGNYFSAQYEGEGIPGGGFSASHTWTEGFTDWYALSGDPTAAENAALVADHYDGAYLNNYDFTNCRDNGWHLLLTMAAFRATGDPYYLNAARIIVGRTLERQSPGGGWHRQMVPGHCLDMPRHRGEANFMLGVLANGLEQYYDEVGDGRVAEAIVGGARQAVAEMWVPEVDGFRYTSCPNMTGYVANNDMTAEVLFFAYRVGGERQFGEIAMRAMRAAFEDGLGSIAHLRWTPHILYNMDLLAREGLDPGPGGTQRAMARRTPTPLPAALADLPADRLITIQAEDFSGQGEGEVRVFERFGSEGTMLSYWDASPGHWLEWNVPVAVEGDYVIYLKYCSGSPEAPRRALLLDGESPGPAFEGMVLPLTGGFCTARDDWAFHAAGDGQAVHLAAGDHRLRLANRGNGVGLDYLILVRQ